MVCPNSVALILFTTKIFAGYALAGREAYAEDIHSFTQVVDKLVRGTPDQYHRAKARSDLERRLCQRYGNFVLVHGWMMLSIMANSASFRNDARQLRNEQWESLLDCIFHNKRSLEIFAKVRNLDWMAPLTRRVEHLDKILTDLRETTSGDMVLGFMHGYVVPEGSENRLRFEIQENLYNRKAFDIAPKPDAWPVDLPFPSDPTTVTYPPFCDACEQVSCSCKLNNWEKLTNPLVELQRYGQKGVGIRVLQCIKAGDYLAEYVGLLTHFDTRNPLYEDNIYNFGFHRPDFVTPFATISSKEHGNWTRYINHSCDENTRWDTVRIGRKYRVMVKAKRDIEVFEELTIDYGDPYFRGKMKCLCGEECCRFQNDDGVMCD